MQHTCACAGRVWITKPGGRNRGRGIEVFDSMRDIERHLASQPCAVPAHLLGKHTAEIDTDFFEMRLGCQQCTLLLTSYLRAQHHAPQCMRACQITC